MYYINYNGNDIHPGMAVMVSGANGKSWSLKINTGDLVDLGTMKQVVAQIEQNRIIFVMLTAYCATNYAPNDTDISWEEFIESLLTDLEELCAHKLKLFHDRMFWQAICGKFFSGDTAKMENELKKRTADVWEFYVKRSEFWDELPKLSILSTGN